ncbi:hypothetical protein ACMYYO_02170 [Dermacoccaceae bacterium W4C1]
MPTTHEPSTQETRPRSTGGQEPENLPGWKRFFGESRAERVVGMVGLVVIFCGLLLRFTVFGDAARTDVGPRVLTGAVYFVAVAMAVVTARRWHRSGNGFQMAMALILGLIWCYFLATAIFSRGI